MWPAAFVHVFTASGIVCALGAVLSLIQGAWVGMFVWLGAALIIDGLDGAFARAARVEEKLPRFSGERLDLVIDYITYVFIPALALLQAGFLRGTVGLLLACSILMSSLYHFSDTASKAEDNSFIGFPAIWNGVAFYIFALGLSPLLSGLVVLVCSVLTFVPLKWAHPLRTSTLRGLTLALAGLWALAALAVLWSGFPAPWWCQWLLVLSATYAVGLTLYLGRAD
jgi:phosphatidylcholine synthase